MNLKKKIKKNFQIKKILKKIEIEPLKKEIITFLNWFSEYNLVPKGMCLKLHLLSGEAITNYEDKNYLSYNKQKFVNKFTLSSDQREIFEEMSKKIINLESIFYKGLQVQEKQLFILSI
jgi:primosomal protein N' (replication factor Y)